jgi:GTP-binding protein LepA
MEIVQERLEREFDQDLITTAPSVVYEVLLNDGTVLRSRTLSKMPDLGKIEEIREPIVTVHLYMPQDYVGPVMTLCNQKRGVQMNMAYHGARCMLTYELPLAEIVLDFFDKLKSVSRGYASHGLRVQGVPRRRCGQGRHPDQRRPVDALSMIVHRARRQYRGREVAAKMRELIPRQMYDVAIQAPSAPTSSRARHQGAAQERAGQVLRRRHHAQEEAARKAEGRQEAHEAGRHRRDAAGSLPGHPAQEDHRQ